MYVFDDSRAPLFVSQIVGACTIADVESMNTDMQDILQRRAPYAMVWGLANAEFPSREVIARVLQVTKELRLLSRELYEGAQPIPAYIAYHTSPRLAKLLQFIMKMSPRVETPMGFFPSLPEAVMDAQRALASFETSTRARSSTR